LAPFFGRGDPDFSTANIEIVNAIYCLPFGKVWLSSVCWSPCAKLGNERKCRIYGRRV